MAAPVRHTCPDIDKLIKRANDPIKWLSDALKSDDLEGIYSTIRDCINHIEDIESIAEDLRSSNDSLRNWGHDLEKEIESKDEIISDLEMQIEQWQS